MKFTQNNRSTLLGWPDRAPTDKLKAWKGKTSRGQRVENKMCFMLAWYTQHPLRWEHSIHPNICIRSTLTFEPSRPREIIWTIVTHLLEIYDKFKLQETTCIKNQLILFSSVTADLNHDTGRNVQFHGLITLSATRSCDSYSVVAKRSAMIASLLKSLQTRIVSIISDFVRPYQYSFFVIWSSLVTNLGKAALEALSSWKR